MIQIKPRLKKLILLTIKSTLVFIFQISFVWHYRKVIFRPAVKHPNPLATSHRTKAAWVSQGKLIDTPGCSLPKTLFLPDGFSMSKDYEPNCNADKRIVAIDYTAEVLTLSADGISSISPNESGCTFFEIHRHSLEDTYKDSQVITQIAGTDSIDIRDKELFATQCGQLINYDAHFPRNKRVGDKVAYWNSYRSKRKNENMPMSVLLIGFDSISRSSFHRSLKKTLPLLQRMGFVDFKGYHSIAPNTLSNFYAFLMGLTEAQLRSGCVPHKLHSFDKCPLIWSEFDRRHFVTMYTEDGKQSFNWEGHGGFRKRPTDYYTHPLFQSLHAYTKRHPYSMKKEQCPSTINSPNFLLNYTKRFLEKMLRIKTPFFAFTWFAYPFHDNTHSLFGFDEKVHEFFQFLNSNSSQGRKLRESSLIILNSDHGERYGDFIQHEYYEGFFERMLPGLFIRLPENLLKQFPELRLAETLRGNSELLTSGFDIHHTLLHLLKLQGANFLGRETTGTVWSWSEDDRSSLFVPVSNKRTCSDINIPPENCLCMKTKTPHLDVQKNNPKYFNSLVDFAIAALNYVVMNSGQGEGCAAHGRLRLQDSFVSWNVFSETETFAAGALRFVTNLNYAEFDVQLRVTHGKDSTEIQNIAKISSFNRLNRYGNSSWCVSSKSGGDRKMKELCHCKKREAA